MVDAANEWDISMKSYLDGELVDKLTALTNKYIECCQLRTTGFPALKVFEKKNTENSDSATEQMQPMDETVCWTNLESCMSSVLERIGEGESTGTYSANRLKGYVILQLHQWIVNARQHLSVSYHWGDMHM